MTTELHHENANEYELACNALLRWIDDNELENDFVIGVTCAPISDETYTVTVWYRTDEGETTYGQLKQE